MHCLSSITNSLSNNKFHYCIATLAKLIPASLLLYDVRFNVIKIRADNFCIEVMKCANRVSLPQGSMLFKHYHLTVS